MNTSTASSTAKSDVEKAIDDAAHSASADKVKGQAKQVVGQIKEKFGSIIGDRELEAEGAAQRADGKKDEIKGDIKEKIEAVSNTVKAGVDLIREKLQGNRKI